MRAEGVGWYGKIRFLNCTLESIPCVNDTVIYGTMYQVRKQMGGGYISLHGEKETTVLPLDTFVEKIKAEIAEKSREHIHVN